MEFETVIGLEIHAELKTETKAFCSCRVSFGEKPNTQCCPVCMGLPGTLPVLNEKVIEYALKAGLGLNCEINEYSKCARKNYFYPDLPKGYQISQGNMPLCKDGFIEMNGRRIRIERLHIEEDAGKLVHFENSTGVDYNRAGVPLVEIVTKPDLISAEEAKAFMEEVRDILVCLDVADCRMQEGGLRCDVNVSVRKRGENGYNPRCEMKNINSFAAVYRAVKYEEERQRKVYEKGGEIRGETRKWDDEKGESFPMRDKESESDYRFFPEPDLPMIYTPKSVVEKIRKDMPTLPKERVKKYIEEYKIPESDAVVIAKNKKFTRLFEEAVSFDVNPKKAANWIMGDISAFLSREGRDEIPFTGNSLRELIELIDEGRISQTVGKEVLLSMFEENKTPGEIVKEKGFTQLNDRSEIESLVKEVLSANEKSAADYRKGKSNALGFLVGQCMKKSGNKANPKLVREILEELI